MKIYWFGEKEGHFWMVILARRKCEAWDILAKEEPDIKTLRELKGKYDLDQVTTITGESGVIANIWPLEVTFQIREKPG